MAIDTIILDFNGTIIDDVDLCLDILNKMLTERGYESISKEKYLDIFGFPVVDYYEKAGFNFPKDNFSELAVEFIGLYQPASLKCKLYPSLIPFIERNYDKKFIILSASEQNNLNEQVAHFHIDKYFDAVLGTTSIEGKGKKDVALDYIKEHHLDPNKTLFIGDTDHDLEVANALNVKHCLVAHGHQARYRLEELTNNVVNSFDEINLQNK